MKKLLSIVLAVLILPTICLSLTACKDKPSIKNFYSSYINIAKDKTNLVLVDAVDIYQENSSTKKIAIKFSNELIDLTENEYPYKYLTELYQPLLDDLLSPVYFFGETVSNKATVNDDTAEQLLSLLKSLENNYNEIDYYAGILMASLKSTNNQNSNLSALNKLFEQYENTFTTAGQLSSLVCDIYFNNVVSNSNIDYSNMDYTDLNDGDLTTITINTRTRLYYYKSLYANVYNQLRIRGGNLGYSLIYENASIPEYTPYTNIAKITNLTKKSDQFLITNKQSIYKYTVSLYNIQNTLDLAYQHFNTATQHVTYLNFLAGSSTTQVNYYNMIQQFSQGIVQDSYEVLNGLITLLYNY